LNPRPLAPKASALPSCATPRRGSVSRLPQLVAPVPAELIEISVNAPATPSVGTGTTDKTAASESSNGRNSRTAQHPSTRHPDRPHDRGRRGRRGACVGAGHGGRGAQHLHQHVHRHGQARRGGQRRGRARARRARATGTFNYRINSDSEILCYDITLRGVTRARRGPRRTFTRAAWNGRTAADRLPLPRGCRQRHAAQRGLHAGPVPDGCDGERHRYRDGFHPRSDRGRPLVVLHQHPHVDVRAGRGARSAEQRADGRTGHRRRGAASAEWTPVALGAAALVGVAGLGVVARRRAQR
jgi:hypothetical protein